MHARLTVSWSCCCAGLRHARAHYQHRNSSRHAQGGGFMPPATDAAAALPHAASTDVLLPLTARDSCSSTIQQGCKDAALQPDCMDSSAGSSNCSQQQQSCLRHRNAVCIAGGGSSNSAEAAQSKAGDGAVGKQQGGVAGMAFKESWQEVRPLLLPSCQYASVYAISVCIMCTWLLHHWLVDHDIHAAQKCFTVYRHAVDVAAGCLCVP